MEINYDELDIGIRDVVKLLVENGIETFSSCEGGVDHSFPMPTVRFYSVWDSMHEEGKYVANILSENGYENFYIKQIYTYQRSGKPYSSDRKHNFLELEFWLWDYNTNSSKGIVTSE